MKVGFVFLLCIFLSACAGPIAKGPKFTSHASIGEDESLFYLYKPYSHDGVTVCLKVLIDNIEKGCLSGNGFVRVNLEPGTHKVIMKPDAFITHNLLEFEVNLEAGAASYFEYYTTSEVVPDEVVAKRFYSFGLKSGHNVIVQKDEVDALESLSTLNESN